MKYKIFHQVTFTHYETPPLQRQDEAEHAHGRRDSLLCQPYSAQHCLVMEAQLSKQLNTRVAGDGEGEV